MHEQDCAKWAIMSDEAKYRTEPATEDESEKVGLLRPLPASPLGTPARKAHPIVKFLGISMRETRRDLLVLILVPLLAAIIDASVYAAIVIGALTEDPLYMFGIPALTAVPVGLTASQMSRALLGALLTALLFSIIFLMFLVSPAFVSPAEELASFFVGGVSLAAIYFILGVFASLFGSFIGIIIREFG